MEEDITWKKICFRILNELYLGLSVIVIRLRMIVKKGGKADWGRRGLRIMVNRLDPVFAPVPFCFVSMAAQIKIVAPYSWIKPFVKLLFTVLSNVLGGVFPQNRWLGSEQLWLQLNLSRAWSTVLVCDNLTFRWLIGLQLIANYLSFNEPTKDATIVTVLLLWDTKLVHFKNLIGMDQGCLIIFDICGLIVGPENY